MGLLDVFDLSAKIRCDTSEYDDALDKASERSHSFLGGLGSVVGTAAKVTTAAVVAAGTAIAGVTQQAVGAYADYEQLTGGIETLFGTGGKNLEEYASTVKATARDIEESGIDWDKYADNKYWSEGAGIQGMLEEMQSNYERLGEDAKAFSEEMQDYLHFEYDLSTEDAEKAINSFLYATNPIKINADFESMQRAQQQMIDNASNAWKTAGLSANEYMETAIESSAAMVSAVGGNTEEAARLMDMSITDMADNVNKMGTTMESIQNAYRGFSRGNFTMLDNLALGFAGTKDGMQELLDKAQEVSGIEYDIDSYADIVQAIHVVQEEMGIAGTTAKEANETISGSLSSMKSAWQNLITGFADPNADLGALIGNMVDAGATYLDNLMPAIEQSIGGIANLIENVAPVIADKLPALIQSVLPALLGAATQLVNALVQALPSLLQIVLDQIPTIINMIVPVFISLLPQIVGLGLQFVLALANGIADSLPTLIPTIVEVVIQIVDTLIDHIDEFIDAGVALIDGLVDGLIKALPTLVNGAVQLVTKLVQRMPEIITRLVEAMPDIITAIVDGLITGLPMLIDGAIALVVELVKNLPTIISGLINAIPEIIFAILSAFAPIGAGLFEVFELAFDGIKEWWSGVVSWFQEIGAQVAEYFQPIVDGVTAIVDFIVDTWNSFMELISPLVEALKYLFETIFQAIQIINERIWTAITGKITDTWNGIVAFIGPILENIKNFITNVWNGIVEFLTPILDGIYDKVSEIWTNIKTSISEHLENIKTFVTDAWNALIDSVDTVLGPIKDTIAEIWDNIVNSAKNWGHDLIDNFVGGIKDKISDVSETITDVADTIRSIIGFSEPEQGPLSNFHTYAPDMIDLFTSGIESGRSEIEEAMENAFALPGAGTMGVAGTGQVTQTGGNNVDMVNMITEALRNIMVQVRIGDQPFDDMVSTSIQRTAYRSGGRG